MAAPPFPARLLIYYVDQYGTNSAVAEWWLSTMWWLCGADGALPFGDAIFTAGALIFGWEILTGDDRKMAEPFYSNNHKKQEQSDPVPPDVTYPGNDSSQPPGEGYTWHGKNPVGGDKGAWVHSKTEEQWHPDLNHAPPKGPHWDYTDTFGNVWSVFEDGRIIIWSLQIKSQAPNGENFSVSSAIKRA